MRAILLVLLLLMNFSIVFSQKSKKDSLIIRDIYSESLKDPQAYHWLDYLSNHIGGRLSGSPEAAAAVEFTRQVMDTMGLSRVFLQEVMVPHWIRGDKEIGKIINSQKIGSVDVPICALGNSIGTGDLGISAEIVEVKSFEELKKIRQRKHSR